jgi:uncharacterized DUF497 family protein
MKLHESFQWDHKKAKSNPKKHEGVTFDMAAAVLGDDQGDAYHVEEFDDAHSIDVTRTVTSPSAPTLTIAASSCKFHGQIGQRISSKSLILSVQDSQPRLRGSDMAKRSTKSELVQRSAGDIPSAAPEDLAQLVAAMSGPIDTSEMPESKGPVHRVKREADGRLPKRKHSLLRTAILEGLRRREMTRYQLWQKARVHCQTLPLSAVYEYLRGQRDIGVPYVEALIEAVGVVVSLPAMSGPTVSAMSAGMATRKATLKPAAAKRRGSKLKG